MRSRYIIYLLFCLIIANAEAQVGVNTITPYAGSVFHIRSELSSPGNYENDLIIDSTNGNLGLGTSTPSAKVEINGSFRFSDKTSTDFSDKILVADSQGNVSWKYFNEPFSYKRVRWYMEDDNYPDVTSSNNIIKMDNLALFSSAIDGASVSNGILTLPKGRYYLTLSGGVRNSTNKYLYEAIKILNGEDVLLENYFFNSATGLALFLDTEEVQNLSVQIEVLDVRSNPSQYMPFADPFPVVGPNKVWAKIDVLKLRISKQ